MSDLILKHKQRQKDFTNQIIANQRGAGVIDKLSNLILDTSQNQLFPGEKHQIIYNDKTKTYMGAVYSGPGTHLTERLKRGDKPLSYVDSVAELHDINYGLAKTNDDIRNADNRMVASLTKAKNQKLDSDFNINQAMLIKAKILLEDKLGVPKEFFTKYGIDSLTPDEIKLYQQKQSELQAQGFGRRRKRRHQKRK